MAKLTHWSGTCPSFQRVNQSQGFVCGSTTEISALIQDLKVTGVVTPAVFSFNCPVWQVDSRECLWSIINPSRCNFIYSCHSRCGIFNEANEIALDSWYAYWSYCFFLHINNKDQQKQFLSPGGERALSTLLFSMVTDNGELDLLTSHRSFIILTGPEE